MISGGWCKAPLVLPTNSASWVFQGFPEQGAQKPGFLHCDSTMHYNAPAKLAVTIGRCLDQKKKQVMEIGVYSKLWYH